MTNTNPNKTNSLNFAYDDHNSPAHDVYGLVSGDEVDTTNLHRVSGNIAAGAQATVPVNGKFTPGECYEIAIFLNTAAGIAGNTAAQTPPNVLVKPVAGAGTITGTIDNAATDAYPEWTSLTGKFRIHLRATQDHVAIGNLGAAAIIVFAKKLL